MLFIISFYTILLIYMLFILFNDLRTKCRLKKLNRNTKKGYDLRTMRWLNDLRNDVWNKRWLHDQLNKRRWSCLSAYLKKHD